MGHPSLILNLYLPGRTHQTDEIVATFPPSQVKCQHNLVANFISPLNVFLPLAADGSERSKRRKPDLVFRQPDVLRSASGGA